MTGIELLRAQRGLISWLAPRLGLSQPAVATWTRIPAERAVEIERITHIPRYLLRPDLWEAPWRGEPETAARRATIKRTVVNADHS